MKKQISTSLICGFILFIISNSSWAVSIFSTDRFGYTGTITRYDTLADAKTDTDAIDSVAIEDVSGDDFREHRDASFYFEQGGASDYAILMSSWWYTIGASAGSGNINGNTGIGFMQLYDDNSSTPTQVDMGFEAFDGTHWTEYVMHVEGQNATSADDYARLSAYNNVNDAGTYLEYALDIRATGLEGVDGGGTIVANNHPTGVTGEFNALFEFGGDSDGYPPGVGPDTGWADDFYRVVLNFDMENWAFSQNGNLGGQYQEDNNIYPSYFEGTARVPEPATLALMGLGLAGIGYRRKRAA